MGAWQPVNVIPYVGADGVPSVDWAGPQGAPFEFEILFDEGQETGTFLGQIRTEPDAATVSASFDPPVIAAPVDGKVTVSFSAPTAALTAGTCFVYEVALDQGDGYVPIVGGSLSPAVTTARP